MNDIFLFAENTNITNYADDSTPYAIESNIDDLLNVLEQDTNILFTWFKNNEMKANDDKCYFLVING